MVVGNGMKVAIGCFDREQENYTEGSVLSSGIAGCLTSNGISFIFYVVIVGAHVRVSLSIRFVNMDIVAVGILAFTFSVLIIFNKKRINDVKQVYRIKSERKYRILR